MSKCAICGKFVSSSDSVKCTGCSSTFDRACLKMSKSLKLPPKWLCAGCMNKHSQKDQSPGVHHNASNSDTCSTSPEAGCSSCDSLKQILIDLRGEMTALRQELNAYRTDLNKRIDGMEDRLASLEARSSTGLMANEANKELLDTVNRLKSNLNDRDQELLLTEVEITCIPENKGENLTQLVCLIAKKLDVKIDDQDIVSVERVGPLRSSVEGEGPPRPRPLAVRLGRRALRDQLLRSARVRRGADTSGFDLSGPPRRFYINERLTRVNRQLFYAARQQGTRLGWKYIWTRDGRIYARCRSDSAAHRIRTELDITKVFGE